MKTKQMIKYFIGAYLFIIALSFLMVYRINKLDTRKEHIDYTNSVAYFK